MALNRIGEGDARCAIAIREKNEKGLKLVGRPKHCSDSRKQVLKLLLCRADSREKGRPVTNKVRTNANSTEESRWVCCSQFLVSALS